MIEHWTVLNATFLFVLPNVSHIAWFVITKIHDLTNVLPIACIDGKIPPCPNHNLKLLSQNKLLKHPATRHFLRAQRMVTSDWLIVPPSLMIGRGNLASGGKSCTDHILENIIWYKCKVGLCFACFEFYVEYCAYILCTILNFVASTKTWLCL